MDIKLIIFIFISAITLASAGVVAFSRNILYSAFALLGVFAGVLGLYIMLSADFVAIAQLVIYIGGILILIGILILFFGNKFNWIGHLPGDIKIEKENFK
ncbi:MAG: NADH-quinone oxidoreductase subunit J, partial [Deltaproteobacteria bacterium]|nr:NADH-quinone oxidoreductase subunit J [Deltaproteobacteria bacterium]